MLSVGIPQADLARFGPTRPDKKDENAKLSAKCSDMTHLSVVFLQHSAQAIVFNAK